MDERTEASAAMKAVYGMKDYNFGRFYILEGGCTNLSQDLLESTLRISQSRHAGTIYARSCAVDA